MTHCPPETSLFSIGRRNNVTLSLAWVNLDPVVLLVERYPLGITILITRKTPR
jgi:hypothetical protein